MITALVMAIYTLSTVALSAQPAWAAFVDAQPAAHHTQNDPGKPAKPGQAANKGHHGEQGTGDQGDQNGNGNGNGNGSASAHGNGGSGAQGPGHGGSAASGHPGQPGHGHNSNNGNGKGNGDGRGPRPAGNQGNGRGAGDQGKPPRPGHVTPPPPPKGQKPPATAPVPLLQLVPPSRPGQPALLAPSSVARTPAATLTVATSRHPVNFGPPVAPRRFGKRPLSAIGAPALSLKAADHLSIPIFFGFGVALFILLQALVDRRDPKVTRAPQRGNDDSIGFN